MGRPGTSEQPVTAGPAGPTVTSGAAGPLVTDLYEVTMALAYLREGLTAPATFSLFSRKLPAARGFLVAAGLADVVDFLEGFAIGDEELAGFAAALGCPHADVEPLRGLRFTGEVWAVPEGRVVLADEPLLEVTAPLPVAQLVETWVLDQVSHQTTLASKAARSVLAAGGRPVVDFSLRRTHGVEAGMHAARAGAIVGFAATSDVAAALAYGMRATGTMAHSFVQVFPDETAAFEAFARGPTGPVTLLVDTYDTEQGVHRAVEVLRTLPAEREIGVRLDSGDLGELAVLARRILDDAGLARARIVASGGLDEYAVEELLAAGAPIDVFAVGTKVGTSADAPYLDAAYKLVEYAGHPVMKLSTGKATRPGAKQVFRGRGCADVLGLRSEDPPPDTGPLLEQVMRAGRRLAPREPAAAVVAAARRRFEADLAELPMALRTIRDPSSLHPGTSPRLLALTDRVRRGLEAGSPAPPAPGAARHAPVPVAGGYVGPMQKFSLDALAREQLQTARQASSGRSARTVYGGHEHVLRQTLIALVAGRALDEHVNPGEATVHVLHGRIRLHSAGVVWDGRQGDLLVVPAAPHGVEATEDAVLLLTVAKGGDTTG